MTIYNRQRVSDEELLEFLGLAADLMEKLPRRFPSKKSISDALGYRHPQMVTQAFNLKAYPSKEKLGLLRELHARALGDGSEEKKEGREEVATRPSMPSMPPSNGVLGELTAVHDDIGKIIRRLERLAEECVPLLRPGILQYAQRLDEGRKVLRIA